MGIIKRSQYIITIFIKELIKNISILLLCGCFFVVLSTVFVIDRQLANGIVSGKYFWFYGSMGLLSVVTLICTISHKVQSFKFSLNDGFVFLFVGSVFLSALVFNDAAANTTKLVNLALLLVLYLYVRLITSNNRQIIPFLFFFIIITGLVEAIWGLMQVYGFRASQHNLFKLTGSFFNPGPYSGYLAVVFPLALYFYVRNIDQCFLCASGRVRTIVLKGLRIFSVITVVAIILVLPAGMSRAAWLAAITGSSVVLVGTKLISKILVRSRQKTTLNLSKRWLKIVVVVLGASLVVLGGCIRHLQSHMAEWELYVCMFVV